MSDEFAGSRPLNFVIKCFRESVGALVERRTMLSGEDLGLDAITKPSDVYIVRTAKMPHSICAPSQDYS